MSQTSGLKFMAVGDICLGDHPISVGFGLCSKIKHMSPQFPFLGVAKTLKSSDIVFGNLECILSRFGAMDTLKTMQMRGYPRFINGIVSSNFRILNLANNHTMQHGKMPFLDTLELLRDKNIRCCGVNTGDSNTGILTVIEHGEAKIGFLGYSLRPRQYFDFSPLYCEGEPTQIIEDIKKYRNKVTFLVLSLHWGQEFVNRPSPVEIRWARKMVDAGANLIIGHHPHVLRGIERYKGGIILYSLGNFVCDMIWEKRLRESLIFSCSIERGRVSSIELLPVYINDNFQPQLLDGLKGQVLLSKINRLSDELHKEDLFYFEEKMKIYLQEYDKQLQIHRRACYKYFLKNMFKYPPKIFFEQIIGAVRRRIN